MFEVLEPEDPRQVGRYRIVARIGAGGMGQVFLGRSPGGRPVAVKVVRPELARDGEFRRRFAREVTAARRVNGAFTAGMVDADPEGSPAGRKRWSYHTGNVVQSSPAVVDGAVYFGGTDDHVYALDAATGKRRWAFPVRGVDSSPAVVDGVVYVGSDDDTLYAVQA